eukprot:TRINITY_DN17900_c0_g1_i3.p6 TRINITY_DN17900_c0_g1~~TRINITY_DN17900_c0_g1_i3.p6  ORF type:complete len:110 (+),score=9.09 TRINITY_DN17900_c0_g1_i3:436-765(+)
MYDFVFYCDLNLNEKHPQQGVAIVLNNRILKEKRVQILPDSFTASGTGRLVGLKIKQNGKNLNLVSVYFPNEATERIKFLEVFEKFVNCMKTSRNRLDETDQNFQSVAT